MLKYEISRKFVQWEENSMRMNTHTHTNTHM